MKEENARLGRLVKVQRLESDLRKEENDRMRDEVLNGRDSHSNSNNNHGDYRMEGESANAMTWKTWAGDSRRHPDVVETGVETVVETVVHPDVVQTVDRNGAQKLISRFVDSDSRAQTDCNTDHVVEKGHTADIHHDHHDENENGDEEDEEEENTSADGEGDGSEEDEEHESRVVRNNMDRATADTKGTIILTLTLTPTLPLPLPLS